MNDLDICGRRDPTRTSDSEGIRIDDKEDSPRIELAVSGRMAGCVYRLSSQLDHILG